jgi:WhiB family redox-sensing transcriptional regulator
MTQWRPAWHDNASCQTSDPEIFFPRKGESDLKAKAVCGRCPVRRECLDWAIGTDQRHGIWGGMSRPERNHEKQSRDYQAAQANAEAVA